MNIDAAETTAVAFDEPARELELLPQPPPLLKPPELPLPTPLLLLVLLLPDVLAVALVLPFIISMKAGWSKVVSTDTVVSTDAGTKG